MATRSRGSRRNHSSASKQEKIERLGRALAMHRAEARAHAERWLEAERARGATSDDFDSFYYDAPIG